jgi:DNA-binding transcriptional LysR family regulator
MTLEQLRVFVAVAERQHVTRAAEALNMAQSAVSAAIAALEARHGMKLFHRVGRGIELTETGSIFLVEAREVIARSEKAELVLAELAGLMRGTLRVMASQTIASYWLPRHLVAFRRAHPGISLSLGIGNTAEVASCVTNGNAELGFIEGELASHVLKECTIAYDQLVIVVSPDQSLSFLQIMSGLPERRSRPTSCSKATGYSEKRDPARGPRLNPRFPHSI